MLAHGASAVILDRLLKQSDEFECFICRQCGLIAEHMDDEACVAVKPRTYCRGCRLEGPEHIAKVHLPYSMKLLAQECGGLNIALRFRVEERGKETLGL
jgi:DNA-directed RNA polymerase beta subunit